MVSYTSRVLQHLIWRTEANSSGRSVLPQPSNNSDSELGVLFYKSQPVAATQIMRSSQPSIKNVLNKPLTPLPSLNNNNESYNFQQKMTNFTSSRWRIFNLIDGIFDCIHRCAPLLMLDTWRLLAYSPCTRLRFYFLLMQPTKCCSAPSKRL